MKKSEEESIIRKTVKASANAFKRAILRSNISRAVEEIREEVGETLEALKRKVEHIADHLMAKVLSFFLLLTGLVFSFVGLYFFVLENTVLPKSTSMIVIGLFVLALGWFGLNANMKTKKKH